MSEIKIQLRKNKKTGGNATITVEDELTLDNLQEFRDKVMEVAETVQAMNFYLLNLNAIDIAAIQFLVAFHKHYAAEGKLIDFHYELTDDAKSLLAKSGFNLTN
ncbi:MAG: hypothetical protein A2275_10230 [Bacteroidetes bacterium RIFOXYA12_FULL_35_11]|nr:MAG: hypothetical protein A2275_10230 [Bacteroidetes bacterium RIFOXYA12_FULL_35_11]HBX49894.1 hypothetical protein [Bacteroidales bacterium]